MGDWDLERALDDRGAEFDVTPYDLRCRGCGALYESDPGFCQLCGCDDLESVEDLIW